MTIGPILTADGPADPIAPIAALDSVDAVLRALDSQRYVADRGLATAIYLSLRLPKPLLLEGEAGVGKTEIAKAMAAITQAPLIRLQCYEGLDVSHAVYEWDYSRQMLHIRMLEATGRARDATPHDIFGPNFLIKRPLLQAFEMTNERPPILLIDELDRADDEFDAFLLEMLSDWQLTIPEIGTIKAATPPIVILTSNRTRELHDALKRRCLYHWIDYPTLEKEIQIVATKVPEAPGRLARQVCQFVQGIRRHDLWKIPGVAETLDWTNALVALGVEELSRPEVPATLGCILKHQDDVQRVRSGLFRELLAEVGETAAVPEAGILVSDSTAR
ncbi:MAG: Carbon monoxide oxidation accessory protein CoxD [uncultured Chloroflexi bacterium]|uniref:Carbon monoxide oxidation accessory protein CoxD n=1 Tax=uncultured Chloroflexota bacterium TaxID=166587 RepID=A0A6J4K5L7_9CHLR|nr:MAG: Carbon monoxide oxidation accessory protein CoxD [uncultured Chloroflexota bacterium]